MRCFESHKVVALDDMRKDGLKITIHKPLECDSHKGENIIYYCNTCSTTACSECVKLEHDGVAHHCEGILDSEMRVRQEMKSILTESEMKIQQLMKSSTGLNNSLEELAHQRSTARDLINESYQSYKAVLEKCKDDALDKLNELYRERELILMKENDKVGKIINNLEDACVYTNYLLEMSTVPEIMYLRKTVADRLLELNNNNPKPEEIYNVEFQADLTSFEKAVKSNFGHFRTEASRESSPLSNAPAVLPPLSINGVVMTNNNNSAGTASSVTNSSPISLPTSMQSSFDGDLSSNMQNFSLAHSPPLPQVNSTAISGFSSIAEYNLAQLATLAESASSATTSPTPPFNLADLLTSDTVYKNLASLAKLGGLGAGKNSFY